MKITFPIGRMVWGSVYEAQTKDFDGNPLTIKSGPDQGKPTQKYSFGVAIPKEQERSWAETQWGALIYEEGRKGFPRNEWQHPDFAWKITDGDSTATKKRATRPINQTPGYPGHWVVSFSSSFPPKLYRDNGQAQLVEPNAIKPGYYIQVAGNVSGNGNLSNPGVYINHELVNLSGWGEEIVTGTDPRSAGFGGALPQGASATPLGGFSPAGFMPGATPALPGMPQSAAPVGLPNMGVPPQRVLVQKAGAQWTIEQCRQHGMTDDQIVQNGIGEWSTPASTPGMGIIANLPMPGATPALPGMPQGAAPVGMMQNAMTVGMPGLPGMGVATPNVAPSNLPPANPATPVRQLVQVPNAQWSIAQCKQHGMTDDQIVQAGVATWGVAPPTGVTPVPSFLNM